MILPPVTFNGSIPLGNLLYVYYNNGNQLKSLTDINLKHRMIIIEITTLVTANINEALILPKKYSEKNL